MFDSDHLKTAVEIRQEIEAVQAEGARLLDAFNGLELTALARKSNGHGHHSNWDGQDAVESTWTLVPERRLQRRTNDNDSASIHSSTSAGTAQSMTRSPHSARKMNVTLTGSRPDFAGSGLALSGKNGIPSIPSVAMSLSRQAIGSTSSVNLHKSSQLPSRSNVDSSDSSERARSIVLDIGEDSPDGAVSESEITDLRRRREEVVARYEARVEYLRAKLRGAELHEKLLRK
jgi:hypothetical protein